MTTARDICTYALKKAGVVGLGQTAMAPMINDAFVDLNDLLRQWRVQRWFVYYLETIGLTSTGAQSYTVGPLGDFVTTLRPPRLSSAFLRQLIPAGTQQVDFPLTILPARETYNEITLKQLTTFPKYIFYENSYPLGRIYPWPIPQADRYAVYLTFLQALQAFTSLDTVVALPPEYEPALKWNLARVLRPSYQKPEDPETSRLAESSLQILVKANVQIPLAELDPALLRPALYNIYSDQAY